MTLKGRSSPRLDHAARSLRDLAARGLMEAEFVDWRRAALDTQRRSLIIAISCRLTSQTMNTSTGHEIASCSH
jgi:hypothetical protein